jgi:aspartate-semialdehyde dehydrogenase
VLAGANDARLFSGAPCTSPHPLAVVLLRVLGAKPPAGLASGHLVALTSTEDEGKAGQDELFNQTVALFNAASFKSKVYKEQVAYNLVPAPSDALGERLRAELEAFLGTGWLAPVQTAKAGAFFGALAAVHLDFSSPGAKAACLEGLKANPALEWEVKRSRGLVHAVKEEGIFVSPAGETERSLQLWVATDPLRSGMAWNLANLADHFFQHRQAN